MAMNDILQTLCALSGIITILIGSAWIKSALIRMQIQ